jgi:predicted AAA+ superfamily ATPase
MLKLIQEELIQEGVSRDSLLSINFESMKNPYVKSIEATYQVIKTFSELQDKTIYLFLDEIQELPGWEKLINSCLVDFACYIYLTGSNAKLLSGELATYLGGRYVEFQIFPLSFREVSQILDLPRQEAFQIYLERGGMPFLYEVETETETAAKYLEDVFDSIIVKDIARRQNIRDIDLLRRLLLYLMDNMGNTFSSISLSRYLKNEGRTVSMETLYNYLSYGSQAFLFHTIPRYNIGGKELLKFQEKVYLTDHGFREALFGSNTKDINQTLENIVCEELLRRGFTVRVGKQGEREVDFVATRQGNILYVQVSYLLSSEQTREREFGSLEAIQDNYPKYVLTLDSILQSRNGIEHRNLIDFLLSDW